MRRVAASRPHAQAIDSKLEPFGIGLAPVALPPRDGHHALDPDLVRQLGESEIVLPAGLPALGERGIGSSARAIGSEEPQAEAVPVHKGALASSCHAGAPQVIALRALVVLLLERNIEQFLGRNLILEAAVDRLAQVLQRVVDGLDRCVQRLMPLQRDAHAIARNCLSDKLGWSRR